MFYVIQQISRKEQDKYKFMLLAIVFVAKIYFCEPQTTVVVQKHINKAHFCAGRGQTLVLKHKYPSWK